MRFARRCRSDENGFTLVEVLVATGAIGIVGAVMFAVLNFGLTLFARNVRMNMAHQEARNGVMRVVRDLHRAVSIPQLSDAGLKAVPTAGPAAGVMFQVVTTGPFEIMNDPSAPRLLQVSTTNPKPAPPSIGDHIVVLDYDVEADITDITAMGIGSNHWNIFLANENEKRIQTKGGSFVICYITRRIGYAVNNGELRYYPNLIATPTTYHVIARNVTSATPFSIPLNQSGTPDTRYTAVNITVTDPTYSNRGFKGTSMQMADAGVPYRCQMTKYQ
jgi:prepilin-type N-terminal cleavage/methylation domain-containing protein